MEHMVTCLTNSSRMLNSSMVPLVQVVTRTEVSTKCNSSIHKISRMMILKIRVVIRCRVTRQLLLLGPRALVCPTQIKGEIEEVIGSKISNQAVAQMVEKMWL
jgi:hypothetical protein